MKNIIKSNLKQKTWLIVCSSILCILLRPFVQIIAYENSKKYSPPKEVLIAQMADAFRPDEVDFIPIILLSVVIALVFFCYLFSKKKVDLYHSIPVDRKNLFMANYISGIIVYLIALTVGLILCAVVAIPNGYMTVTALQNLFSTFVYSIVHFLFGYSVTIFAIMLTGNILVALAATVVFFAAAPVIGNIIYYFKNAYFVTMTYIQAVTPPFETKYYYLSPVTSLVELCTRCHMGYSVGLHYDSSYYDNISCIYPDLIPSLIVTFLFVLAGYLVYMKRPSEAAEKALSFKKTNGLIRVPLSIIGGLFGALFMCMSLGLYKNKWIWLGVLIGVILTHCVLEIIFNESFRKLFVHKFQFVISLVAALLIIGYFYFDMGGYDKYIPDREDIKTASIYMGEIDNNVSNIVFEENSDSPGYYIARYMDSYNNSCTQRFTDEALIDSIYSLNKVGLTCVDDMIEIRFNTDYTNEATYAYEAAAGLEYPEVKSDKEDVDTTDREELYKRAVNWMDEMGIRETTNTDVQKLNIQIFYELKNGRKITRQYDIPITMAYNEIEKVYNSETFNRAHFDMYKGYEEGIINKVEVYDIYDNKVMSVSNEMKDEFLDIYVSELENIKLEMLKSLPVGKVMASVKTGDVFEEAYSGYYIYPQFKKTLAYMESNGVSMQGFNPKFDASVIGNIAVNAYSLFTLMDGNVQGTDGLIYDNLNDMDMIKMLSENLVNSNLQWSNSMLINYDKESKEANNIDILVYLNFNNGIQKCVQASFEDGKIPKEVKKDLIIKMYLDNN